MCPDPMIIYQHSTRSDLEQDPAQQIPCNHCQDCAAGHKIQWSSCLSKLRPVWIRDRKYSDSWPVFFTAGLEVGPHQKSTNSLSSASKKPIRSGFKTKVRLEPVPSERILSEVLFLDFQTPAFNIRQSKAKPPASFRLFCRLNRKKKTANETINSTTATTVTAIIHCVGIGFPFPLEPTEAVVAINKQIVL